MLLFFFFLWFFFFLLFWLFFLFLFCLASSVFSWQSFCQDCFPDSACVVCFGVLDMPKGQSNFGAFKKGNLDAAFVDTICHQTRLATVKHYKKRGFVTVAFWGHTYVCGGKDIFGQKKCLNTGRKRGGNSGHTICSPCLSIFLRIFEAKIRKRLQVSKKSSKGASAHRIFQTQRGLKHYKNRGFKRIQLPKWRKVGHKNYKAKTTKANCTKIPPPN